MIYQGKNSIKKKKPQNADSKQEINIQKSEILSEVEGENSDSETSLNNFITPKGEHLVLNEEENNNREEDGQGNEFVINVLRIELNDIKQQYEDLSKASQEEKEQLMEQRERIRNIQREKDLLRTESAKKIQEYESQVNFLSQSIEINDMQHEEEIKQLEDQFQVFMNNFEIYKNFKEEKEAENKLQLFDQMKDTLVDMGKEAMDNIMSTNLDEETNATQRTILEDNNKNKEANGEIIENSNSITPAEIGDKTHELLTTTREVFIRVANSKAIQNIKSVYNNILSTPKAIKIARNILVTAAIVIPLYCYLTKKKK